MKITALLLLSGALSASGALAQSRPNIVDVGDCGHLSNHFGPHDYRTASPSTKSLVEVAHFTPGVEALRQRKTGPFGGDIAYTLRVFPNHPRALYAMERLAEKERRDPPEDARMSVECYYIRALTYLPEDHTPRLLYAKYLAKLKRMDTALEQVDFVAKTTPDNPVAQLNAGRVYVELKAFEKARQQVLRLKEMGFDAAELRDALAKLNEWSEAAPATPESAASAAPAAASAP
jgi:predicted Zn-dependent protease